MNEPGDVVIYQTEDGLTNVHLDLHDGNVWLTTTQIAALFEENESAIREHIKSAFEDGELVKEKNVQTSEVEGTTLYDLSTLISVAFHVKTHRGAQFRHWAIKRLTEYMVKGFALDDERLKERGGGNYWKELLDRIRDIRSSEKVMFRQVLDLFATSTDYNPKSSEAVRFFEIVHDKLHYAAHGHTADEVIYERADATKPFMGLKSFKGAMPVLSDVKIAKNYLDENELKALNNIVSGYFEFTELQALRHKAMHMHDYIEHLDRLLLANGEKLLEGSGTVSHKKAMEKAESEYRKYQVETLTPVEEAYLKALQNTEKAIKKKIKKQ